MHKSERFKRAIERFDEANAADPRRDEVDGTAQPRELLFARGVYVWIQKLVAEPSEALLLAARSHTLRRWIIPRDRYPMTTPGYHQWRNALAEYHADEAEKILLDVGYDPGTIPQVRALITKANWPADPEALALEDADCLAFLETKLSRFVDAWDDEKMTRVLGQTYRKMTPEARRHVATLSLGERERKIVEQVVSGIAAN